MFMVINLAFKRSIAYSAMIIKRRYYSSSSFKERRRNLFLQMIFLIESTYGNYLGDCCISYKIYSRIHVSNEIFYKKTKLKNYVS